MFLKVGVDAGNRDTNAAIGIANFLAENLGCVSDQGENCEGYQRHPPGHVEHDRHDSDQDEHVLENRDHSGGEHVVESVDIGGHARNEAADGIFVVETDVHPLEMAEDLASQIEHDHLSRPLHEIGLQIIEQETEGEQTDASAPPPVRFRATVWS